MKILNKLAMAALASALILTGCQNSLLTATSLNTSFTDTAGKGVAIKESIYVATNGAATPQATKNQEISLKMYDYLDGTALPAPASNDTMIDQSSIAKAVTFYNLTAGANADAVYVEGAALPASLLYYDIGTGVAYFSVDCTTANALIEVMVNSQVLTARSGNTKMDLDGDKVKGEVGDDDFYAYYTVGTYTPPTGAATVPAAVVLSAVRNPRAGMTLTPGAGLEELDAANVAVTGTAITHLNNAFRMTYTRLGTVTADTNNYLTLFNDNIALQRYDTASNTWITVPKLATSTYNTATGVYIARFDPIPEGTAVRARYINLANFKTASKYYGFFQRPSSDDFLKYYELMAVYGNAYMQLSTANQSATLSPVVTFDSNGLNGKLVITVNNTSIGNLGIDPTTVTTSSIQILSTAPAPSSTQRIFNWTGTAAYTYTYDAGTAKSVVSKIILNIDPTYTKTAGSYKLIVTKNLKGLGTQATPTGTITNAGYYFGDVTNVPTTANNPGTGLIGTNLINGVGQF